MHRAIKSALFDIPLCPVIMRSLWATFNIRHCVKSNYYCLRRGLFLTISSIAFFAPTACYFYPSAARTRADAASLMLSTDESGKAGCGLPCPVEKSRLKLIFSKDHFPSSFNFRFIFIPVRVKFNYVVTFFSKRD